MVSWVKQAELLTSLTPEERSRKSEDRALKKFGYKRVNSTRFKPSRPSCYHHETVPVCLKLTGELVAHLCVSCDKQLPPGFDSEYGPYDYAPEIGTERVWR